MKTFKIFLFFSFLYFFSNYAIADCWYYSWATMEDGSAQAAVNVDPTHRFIGGYLNSYTGVGAGRKIYTCSQVLTSSCDYLQRDVVTGACASSVSCTAGQTKTLLILAGTYPPAGTPPTFKLNQDRTSVVGVPTTVSQGGCVYNLPLNPNQNTGCSTSASGLLYCRVQATQTGASLTGADTALDAASESQLPVPEASPGCIRTPLGDSVCASTPKLNCGTVNGSEVCMTDTGLQSNGYPASMIDGVVVAKDTNVNGQVQNCFVGSSGKSVCVELPEGGTTGSCAATYKGMCIGLLQTEPTTAQPTSKIIPLSKDVKEVTKTASLVNPDASRIETKTTTSNIVGTTATVTTNEFNPAGVLTTSSTVHGNTTGTGVDGVGKGAQPDTSTGNSTLPAGDDSGLDTVFGNATSGLTSSINNSSFITSFVSLAAPSTCQTIPMNYGRLNYTFDPCGKLAAFREMFAFFLYVVTAIGIYQIATRSV
jgi:hypothetical protein